MWAASLARPLAQSSKAHPLRHYPFMRSTNCCNSLSAGGGWASSSKPRPGGSSQKTARKRSIWEVEEIGQRWTAWDHPTSGGAPDAGGCAARREVAGLTPEDIDFDAASSMGTFTVNPFHAAGAKDTLAQVDRLHPPHLPGQAGGQQDLPHPERHQDKPPARTIFMTAALRGLKQWLERLGAGRSPRPGRYRNSRMLLRLPTVWLAQPVLVRKKFEVAGCAGSPHIIFHGLQHLSATYQLMISAAM